MFVVQLPDLVLPFVAQPGILGLLYLYLQVAQLVSQPDRGLGRSVISAAQVLLGKIGDVRVQDLRSQLWVGGLKRDVQQTALRHAFYAQAVKKRTQLGRTLVVGQASGGDGLGSRGGASHLRMRHQAAIANGLQRHGFAGQNT